MYDMPTANIILNEKKLKVFPLRFGTRQEGPLSPQYSIRSFKGAVTPKKEIKGIQIRRKEVKLSFL
jgi:hypothetical protein